MCRRIDCYRCGKATFSGCGMHVEQVLGDVPHSMRCDCHAPKTAAISADVTSKPRACPRWVAVLLGFWN